MKNFTEASKAFATYTVLDAVAQPRPTTANPQEDFQTWEAYAVLWGLLLVSIGATVAVAIYHRCNNRHNLHCCNSNQHELEKPLEPHGNQKKNLQGA